jgi:hypothetical protein
MALKENTSIKKNPYTTIIGYLLMLISVALFVIPYFMDLKQEVDSFKLAVLGAIGLFLVLSPDKLIGIIERKAE